MANGRVILLGLAAVTLLMCCSGASAQLSLGTVSRVTAEACPVTVGGQPAEWVTTTSGGSTVAASCYHADVSCPNMPDLGVTYGVATPARTSKGTIVFVSAQYGTFTLPGKYQNEAPFDLFHNGFQTVQFAWDGIGWQYQAIGSLKAAACRVATFLDYINTQFYQANPNSSPTAGMCAHGQSGGAGGLAFSLTYYGAGSYLDKAVFVSGPQYGDLVQGCTVPNSPPVSICPGQNGIYPMGCNNQSGTWTEPPVYNSIAAKALSTQLANNPVCNDPNHTYTVADEINLAANSLVDGAADASYNYPQTAITAWECDDDSHWKNPSEVQGWTYLSQLSSPGQVAPNCNHGFNTAFPNACFIVQRVYGCQTVELAATGYVCNGATCPVCSGDPAINCTCGGLPCNKAGNAYSMPNAREADYEDLVNGCIKRH